MTSDNCRVGVECTTEMNKIFKKIVNPFSLWVEKYEETCPIVKEIYKNMDMKYGNSRTTILEGIDRKELSQKNLTKLNEIINDSKNKYIKKENNSPAFESEYIADVVKNLGNHQLKDILDNCIRKEAIDMKLIIVDKNKGWFPVNNLSKLSCPRITSGGPRINYNW